MANKKKMTYDIRFRGRTLASEMNSKSEAYKLARDEAMDQGATARYKVRVYGLQEGQTRGQLMYRCWVNKLGKVIGEDR